MEWGQPFWPRGSNPVAVERETHPLLLKYPIVQFVEVVYGFYPLLEALGADQHLKITSRTSKRLLAFRLGNRPQTLAGRA